MLALSVSSALAWGAQNPPADQTPPSQAPASQSQKPPEKKKEEKLASQPQTPPEKTKEEKPANPLQLKLETPQAPPAQAPQQPAQKPAPPPTGQAPQNLQLETPKQAPAQQPPAEKAAPAAQAPAAPPHEPTVESIIFRGNRRAPAATLRARIFTHQGDVYNEGALERDFMALWNTGYFDDIRLEATDTKDGNKILTFFLREKKLIRSIDYKGLSTVQTSDVLDEFKKRKVGLSIQSQYDPVVIKRAEVVLEQMLAAHGRQFATVRHRTRNIPPNSVALTFIVAEGPKVKVGNIRFQGNTIFSRAKLERAMKYSRPAGAPPFFYWFHKTYDKDRIQADLENIRDLYRDRGYFYALPKDPQTKMVDTSHRLPFFFWSWGRGKRVDMTIPIEEGVQYRLGKFVIRGNKLFQQKQIMPVLQMKSGDIFALSKVRKAIENYTKLYGMYGYINFTASPNIEPDNKRRLINLALDFDEDKQFFVHRIQFSGNTKTRDKVIRRELMVDEGNVFNSQLWDLSVLRINQLGFFDTVKKEDYDIKQNTKDSTVDITLKVKEKGRNSIGFSGGVSGLAGNFVGINYSTNNFLGLGETLSLQFQWGTFQKLYSFGFTEPYLFDRAITTGFTIFKSDYRYDELRQTAFYTGINPQALAATPYGQFFAQNFQQNSAGFSVFASYPLRRSFARVGVTYSFSRSSLQTFSPASTAFFEAINFRGLAGPNALAGITSSTIMPTYLYNTVNDAWNPTHGKYLSATVAFTGSILGGNTNTLTPTIEAKYFHPVAHKRSEKPQAIGVRLLAAMTTGYGGKVAPPFSRFYIGGEQDIRGFDIRSISPVAFYPSIQQVCNRDQFGNQIWATGVDGRKQVGTCGSYTQFPYESPIFPGGDTEVVINAEYTIPIAGPVTLGYFVDAGSSFILRTSQLKLEPNALNQLSTQFPSFPIPGVLRPISGTNFKPRSSTGLDLQVVLPIVNAPFHLYYGYNWLRMNQIVTPPQNVPPCSIFPNQATCNDMYKFFAPFRLQERKSMVGFTVVRTF
ncbi:MAG: outer membrane protein assembly factor BamA [Acidobacteriia bacterium]|nr:outer membrane protein assembly factor BamA [Terriglobia bacterium]